MSWHHENTAWSEVVKRLELVDPGMWLLTVPVFVRLANQTQNLLDLGWCASTTWWILFLSNISKPNFRSLKWKFLRAFKVRSTVTYLSQASRWSSFRHRRKLEFCKLVCRSNWEFKIVTHRYLHEVRSHANSAARLIVAEKLQNYVVVRLIEKEAFALNVTEEEVLWTAMNWNVLITVKVNRRLRHLLAAVSAKE